MFRKEREVVESIRAALLQVADATSLAINAAEFGEVLNGLVREYDRAAEEMDDTSALQRRIWVTTPEGIDGYSTDVVFFLGCDNKHIPRPYSEPWPFYANEVDEYQERERYMFLAVVRAASQRLHFSYSRSDESGTYRPSPYLEEARELLANTEWEQETYPGPVEAPASAPPTALGQARRTEYSLDEIAHFALCPYRYKLERLDQRARQYTDDIQVRLLAQGVWLGLIMEYVMEERLPVGSADEFTDVFQKAKQSVEQRVKEAFPGFRPLDWIRVDRYVRRSLRGWRDFYVPKIERGYPPFRLSVVAIPQTTLSFVNDEQIRRIAVPLSYAFKIGRFDYPQINDRLRNEWLIPGRQEPSQGLTEADGVPVYASLYDAQRWWSSGLRLAFNFCHTRGTNPQRDQDIEQQHTQLTAEALAWMQRIEAGRYPKNPGSHCQYCPVRNACLGVEP